MTLKRSIATTLLVTTIPACMGTYRVAPEKYLATNSADRMLVVDKGGQFYDIYGPAIVEGNLVGLEEGTSDSLSLPVAGLEEALVRHKSTVRTAILVGTLGTIGSLAVIGATRMGKGYACSKGASSKDVIQGTGTEGCDSSIPIPNGQ